MWCHYCFYTWHVLSAYGVPAKHLEAISHPSHTALQADSYSLRFVGKSGLSCLFMLQAVSGRSWRLS